jgi:hypothetical protein
MDQGTRTTETDEGAAKAKSELDWRGRDGALRSRCVPLVAPDFVLHFLHPDNVKVFINDIRSYKTHLWSLNRI